MTEPRFTGREGGQKIAWLGGSEHEILLSGEHTHDALSLIRSRMRAGTGSPVHVHPGEDETIHFLTGSAHVWVGHK